jgi:hypothetical protein
MLHNRYLYQFYDIWPFNDAAFSVKLKLYWELTDEIYACAFTEKAASLTFIVLEKIRDLEQLPIT